MLCIIFSHKHISRYLIEAPNVLFVILLLFQTRASQHDSYVWRKMLCEVIFNFGTSKRNVPLFTWQGFQNFLSFIKNLFPDSATLQMLFFGSRFSPKWLQQFSKELHVLRDQPKMFQFLERLHRFFLLFIKKSVILL